MNNENMSSGKGLTLVKTTLFAGSGAGDSGGFSANQSKL